MSEYFAEFRERRARRTWDRGQVREIRVVGDPVLRSPCDEVRTFDAALRRLVDDMFATMYAADGVGLAANQIGVGRCVFVYDCGDDEDVWHRGVVVNPLIAEAGRRAGRGRRGLPLAARLLRTAGTPVAWSPSGGRTSTAEPVEITGTGYFARCLRHEDDHLRGRIFTDLVTGEARKAALRAIRGLSPR